MTQQLMELCKQLHIAGVYQYIQDNEEIGQGTVLALTKALRIRIADSGYQSSSKNA